MTVKTHHVIGYTDNIKIIETALREKFGLNDNSFVLTAVAAHIWSIKCSSTDIEWDENDIWNAIDSCMRRLDIMKERINAPNSKE